MARPLSGDDPTWTQEQTRRPRRNPRQTPDTIAEAIIHLYQAWESQESRRTSVATIWQALKEQGIAPLPSRRPIYRIVQHHSKEANRDTPHRQSHRLSGHVHPELFRHRERITHHHHPLRIGRHYERFALV